jgi:hypothetical protein
MQDTYGHTTKPKGRGFKLAHTHSPKKRLLQDADADADDAVASAAFPTTAARDLLSAPSSSAMLIDDPTVSSTPSASSSGSAMQIAAPSDTRDLGSASSAASAMQIAAPSDTRDLGSASSAASAMQIAAPSVPQPTPSSSAAQVRICFSNCSTPPTAHVPDALTHLTHRTH